MVGLKDLPLKSLLIMLTQPSEWPISLPLLLDPNLYYSIPFTLFFLLRLYAEPRQVKAIYLAASHLKMESVVHECARHLMENLHVDTCIDTRSLPGITRQKSLVSQVDAFIADKVSYYFAF